MLSNGSLLTVLTVTLGILSRTYWGIVLGSYVTCITPSEIVTEGKEKLITMCHKSRSYCGSSSFAFVRMCVSLSAY